MYCEGWAGREPRGHGYCVTSTFMSVESSSHFLDFADLDDVMLPFASSKHT